LKPWKAAVDAVAKRDIAEVKALLYRNDCAFGECNIGDFYADAMVDFITNREEFQVTDGWTYAAISIINAGGIRTSIPSGMMNFDDLFTTIPFGNTVDTFELLGEDLLKMLQFSADAYRYYNFMQFSGMRVVFNVTKPMNERVVSVKVICRECDVPRYEDLDLTKWYRVISPSFIGGGGNGYVMLKNRRNFKTEGIKDTAVTEYYFKKMSPVIQKKDGRIVILT
jgi:5'-nucleotidase